MWELKTNASSQIQRTDWWLPRQRGLAVGDMDEEAAVEENSLAVQ